MLSVGFIGLGAIGEPMAAHLLQQGFQLVVCGHHNHEPVERMRERGATVVATPRDVAAQSTIVVTCVPDAPQVEEVCLGPKGIVHGAKSGTIVVDCSTIAPNASRRIAAALAEHEIAMLDAPISGGPVRAADGTLTLMVGGDAAVLEKARPVLEALGSNIFHIGSNGAGEVVKLANNTIIAVTMLAISEAFTFGVKSGVDAATMREVIQASSGANYLLDRWLPDRMLKDDYSLGFATSLMRKDVGVAVGAARELDVPMFVSALAHQFYALAEQTGYGRMDYSAVSQIYQDAANITIADGTPRKKSDA